ncbi:kinase-like domain-containing protein [Trichoderma sp. SZMC 28013]
MAIDGRLLSLYLEKLPPSLVHKDQELQRPFPPHHALKILQGISSALKYLAIQNVLHFDIKGGNIAYSPSCPRGAVLFDFNLACVGNNEDAEQTYGTRWYVPPEFLDKTRGRAGDIWALGVTMLDIMGKIEHPESTADWNLNKAQNFGSADRRRMKDWLDYIEARRRALSGEKLESLVFRMLHPDDELRVEAAELEAQAAAIELSE